MVQTQMSIKNCIEQIIQQNSVLQNIFHEIKKQGGQVLLVGGAVRDCLLGTISSDLDFEIYHLSFEQLEKVLQQFGNVSFIGKSFGVLRLHGLDVDWSIPRKDSIGRKPTVSIDPNMSYIDAFRRRDVTVNAMGVDVHSLELIDPYNGYQDLQNRILRAPDVDFFKHDPLRLFRVMQFIGRFEMMPDDDLNEVCRKMDISQISSDRIDAEFAKLFLKSQQPSRGLRWLEKIGWFKKLFSNLANVEQMFIEIDCLAQTTIKGDNKLAAMWGILGYHLQDLSFPRESIVTSFVASVQKSEDLKNEKNMLKSFVKVYVQSSKVAHKAFILAWYLHYLPVLSQEKNLAFYKWLAYWMNPDITLELLGIVGSCMFDPNTMEDFIAKAQDAGVLHGPEEALLEGKDLLGYAEGKELGELLKKAYEMQLNEGIESQAELKKKLLS